MNKLKKTMGLLRSFLIISALVLSTSYTNAAYDDDGTDYSDATGGSWIEDASKQALNMVNAFVCIIKNSNGHSRPNGTWRMLIDEVACGLNGEDDTAWADAVNVSTRASDSSDQEIISYFTSADGSKYVASTTLNESATSSFDLTMLFKWYAANDIFGDGGEDLTSSGWVDGAQNPYGYSEITVEDYDSDGTDDTVIRTAETFGAETLGGIAVTYGGTPVGAATAFLVSAPDYSNDDGGAVTYSGALNDTEYLRRTYNPDTEEFGNDTCFAMDDPYQTVYRYGVYDATTGEELAISGSFGFTYEEGAGSGGSGRGFMGHWGSWFENRSDKLSLTNTSLDITRESDSASMTLNWAPGKMWQKESSSETLVNGEKFEVTDWSNGSRENVIWQTNNFFDTDGVAYTFGDGSSISEGDWIFSERFNTWVGFLGANGDGVFQLFVEQNTQVRAHWDGRGEPIDVSEEVSFTCFGDCPNALISYNSYSSWSYNDRDNNSGDTYILTPYDEARAGIYPLSLYKDNVAAANLVALNANDNDFQNDQFAHIWTGDFVPSDELGVGTCAADDDPDAANNIYNCENIFAWESGLREWGQHVFPTDADGAVVIQDPINFTYTHAAANDRNNAIYPDEDSPFIYNWVQTDWDTMSQTQVDDQETYVSKFDGMKINLQYEGVGELWGFPERQTDNGWLKLVNLADGTEITRVSDSSTYVVKMLDSGLLLNQAVCSGDLEVPAAFEDLDIIPSPTDKTQPSQIFNNAPTVEDIHVKQGEDLIDPSLVQANS